MSHPVFDFLAQRSSTPISAICEPAPEGEELAALLKVAARVPDHGRLTPWRFILYRGDTRRQVGEYLVKRAEEREGPLSDAQKDKEATRFSRAPLVVGVIFSPLRMSESRMGAVPFAGAVAMNLASRPMRWAMRPTGSATGMRKMHRRGHFWGLRRMSALPVLSISEPLKIKCRSARARTWKRSFRTIPARG